MDFEDTTIKTGIGNSKRRDNVLDDGGMVALLAEQESAPTDLVLFVSGWVNSSRKELEGKLRFWSRRMNLEHGCRVFVLIFPGTPDGCDFVGLTSASISDGEVEDQLALLFTRDEDVNETATGIEVSPPFRPKWFSDDILKRQVDSALRASPSARLGRATSFSTTAARLCEVVAEQWTQR